MQGRAPRAEIRADNRRFLATSLPRRPLLRRGVLEGRSRDSFFEACFCLGWILALSVENGRIMGLSRLCRSLCFPLGISVEISDVEIEGLESRSGLIIGDFLSGSTCSSWLWVRPRPTKT